MVFFFSFGISYCQVTGLRMPLVYKLFLQTSVVTFVKCLLLSLLKVKTMKYYLNCNPRKCPKTTCPSLESCQNKERAKVKPENNNWRCHMRLPSQVEPMGYIQVSSYLGRIYIYFPPPTWESWVLRSTFQIV